MINKLRKIEELHNKIYELTQEVNREKEEIERSGLNPKDIELAELLHENLCHANHIDGCDWNYGGWDSNSYSKKEYVKKARKLKESGFKYQDVEKFFECIK